MDPVSEAALAAGIGGDPPPVRVQPERTRGGEWVTLGDEQYRIPPLAFRSIQDLGDDIEGLKDIIGRPTPEQMGVVGRIVLAAIQRNYPSMTMERLDDMLDIGNYQAVLGAVLSIGGFRRAEGPPGEAPASTGSSSTSA